MRMHNPPHPGDFIKVTYVEPFKLSTRYLAQHLHVSPSTINRLINCQASVSPEMAYRLSAVLGRSPESWLALQAQYDLWETKKSGEFDKLESINFKRFSSSARQHARV